MLQLIRQVLKDSQDYVGLSLLFANQVRGVVPYGVRPTVHRSERSRTYVRNRLNCAASRNVVSRVRIGSRGLNHKVGSVPFSPCSVGGGVLNQCLVLVDSLF